MAEPPRILYSLIIASIAISLMTGNPGGVRGDHDDTGLLPDKDQLMSVKEAAHILAKWVMQHREQRKTKGSTQDEALAKEIVKELELEDHISRLKRGAGTKKVLRRVKRVRRRRHNNK